MTSTNGKAAVNGKATIAYDAIPVELTERKQWVLWRSEKRGKLTTKIPRQRNGRKAQPNNPATWCTFDEARDCYESNPDKFSGIGYVFADDDPFCGVDLDLCLVPESGFVAKWAADVLQLPGYAEISPSGNGVKLLTRGRFPVNNGATGATFKGMPASGLVEGKQAEIAPWNTGRFFTITGRVFDGKNTIPVDDCNEECERLFAAWETKYGDKPSAAPNQTASEPVSGDDVHDKALTAMRRIKTPDGADGSKRLYTCACRCVEHNLSDSAAIATVRALEAERPFPGTWSDDDILRRVRDAERRVERGSATKGGNRGCPHSIERYEPFPTGALPEPLRSFVAAGAKSIICDPALVALPLLCGLASAVGATRRLRINRDWHEPCVLWGAVVSVSGSQKSPTQHAAVRHLEEAQAFHIEQESEKREAYELDKRLYEEALRAWMKSKSKGNTDPPPDKPSEPVTVRYIVDNATIESLGTRLNENPRGLLVSTDELSAWLGSMGRYSGGKSQGEKGQWLSMYRAGRLLIDRKTGDKKTIHVRHAATSIIGGIPPNTLRKLIAGEDMDNGLAARLLIAMPPRQPKRWSDEEIPESVDNCIKRLYGRLLSLDFDLDENEVIHPVDIILDADATRLAKQFVNEHGDEQSDLDEHVASVWSKLEAVAFRLALLFSLVRWADGVSPATSQGPVTADDLTAAIRLVEWFGNEWRRFYATFGESEADSERRRLVDWIESRGGVVSVRDLTRGPRDYRETDTAEAALNELAKAGIGEWTDKPTGPKGGCPTRVFRLLPSGDGDRTPENPGNCEVVSPSPVSPAPENTDSPAGDWGEL